MLTPNANGFVDMTNGVDAGLNFLSTQSTRNSTARANATHHSRHEGHARRPYLGNKHPGRAKQLGISPPKKGTAMPNNDIVYLLKFAPKEAYIDDLMNGHLYMNAISCYQGLPSEQGDPLEASIVPGVCLYGKHCLPICCMYTLRKNDTVKNCVHIPMR